MAVVSHHETALLLSGARFVWPRLACSTTRSDEGLSVRRIVLLVVAVFVVLVGYAPAAHAAAVPAGLPTCTVDCPAAGTDAEGFVVQAKVHFSGDAAPGGASEVTVPVPAMCWWRGAKLSRMDGSPVDPNNPDEIESWFKVDLPKQLGSMGVAYGALSKWQPSLDKMRAGEKITAYEPRCRGDAPDCTIGQFAPQVGVQGPCLPAIGLGFYPTGNVPVAQVAPADLALAAQDRMDIPDPQVDRNPKVTAMAGATLVGLPTWFWVTDPTSVGGALGTRTIRAAVGPVWAQVVAETNGLYLSSPAGYAECGPDKALTQYGRGVDESAACTISFDAASVGYSDGYPVDASTAWTATWTGSGNTGGALAPLQRGIVVDVPVAESQTVVTYAR